jgi:uncharacterized membrane protein
MTDSEPPRHPDEPQSPSEPARPGEPQGPGEPHGPAEPAHGPEPRHWTGADPWLAWVHKAEQLGAGRMPGFGVPAWLRPTRGERRWPITASVIAAIVLQVLLPPRLTEPLPGWLMPSLEGALLIGLTIADPVRVERGGTAMRAAGIALILLVSIANAVSAVLLIRAILEGKAGHTAGPLFASGASIWLTNVIVFGLWYWEFDRGGPVRRAAGTVRHPDLMFPQMTSPQLAPPDWESRFVDYLYLSFTNATAFSPTDVMPLARWAKLTMLVQSALSLAVGALVIARAVNILKA